MDNNQETRLDVPATMQDFFDTLNAEMQHERAQTQGCSECQGRTYIPQGQVVINCACHKRRQWESLYTETGIPRPMFDMTLDLWNGQQFQNGDDLSESDRRAKSNARHIIEGYCKALPFLCSGSPMKITIHGKKREFNSILCTGGKGAGKSMLAAIVAKSALQSGLPTRYYRWMELTNWLSKFEYAEKQDQIAHDFQTKNLIVIDGICNPHIAYPQYLLQLDRLFEIRQSVQQPTFMTASENYDQANLGQIFPTFADACLRFNLPTPERQGQTFWR